MEVFVIFRYSSFIEIFLFFRYSSSFIGISLFFRNFLILSEFPYLSDFSDFIGISMSNMSNVHISQVLSFSQNQNFQITSLS